MDRSKKKAPTRLLALLLTLILALSFAAPLSAFAADYIDGSEATPAKAHLTKILELPTGTTTPTADFKFEFTPISVDGGAATDAPTIGTSNVITISYVGDDTATSATGGIDSIVKTANIFGDGTDFFPHAGVYVYEVVENQSSYTTGTLTGFTENLTYSKAKYTITAYVLDKNPASAGTYIEAIGTTIEVNEDGTAGSGGKVNPGTEVSGSFNAMTFTNQYTKTKDGGGNPTDPDDSTLTVSKDVDGEYASKTFYFPFSITLDDPSTLPTTPTPPTFYRAYVVEGSNVVTSTANADSTLIDVTSEPGKPFIKVPANGSVAFNLKHNQRLVFIDTPVGTIYTVNESGTAGYTPKVDVVYNGGSLSTLNGSLNGSLSTNAQSVGEAANSAAYLNEREAVSPTGFSFSDLPYITLIALALIGLAGFIVFRVRRSKSNA
jgi:hypothetical protein